uniref:Uncharacterized protein n=1 Tax=Arundo donax TaxID=35708 RepID=A0A0A8Y8E6_ARUDO
MWAFAYHCPAWATILPDPRAGWPSLHRRTASPTFPTLSPLVV